MYMFFPPAPARKIGAANIPGSETEGSLSDTVHPGTAPSVAAAAVIKRKLLRLGPLPVGGVPTASATITPRPSTLCQPNIF